MKRIWVCIAAVCVCLLSPAGAFGQNAAFNGFCWQGGTSAMTSGLPSTNKLNGVVPSCTVTVYLTGTTTLATIFSTSGGGTLSNPFTANNLSSVAPGQWLFYAAETSAYDVVMSGGIAPNTYAHPVTLTGMQAGSGGGGGGGSPAPPSFAVQFANSGASAFQADTTTVFGGGSALSYTPLTHTIGANALNGLTFISPFQTGAGGNGQANYFPGKTNALGIQDNLELSPTGATDGNFPVGNGNVIFNLNTTQGMMGFWATNPVPNNLPSSSFSSPDSPLFTVALESTDGSLSARAAYAALMGTNGQGFNRGNGQFTAHNDQGWTTSGHGLTIAEVLLQSGIKNGIELNYYSPDPGDVNGVSFDCTSCETGATGFSDEGIVPFRANIATTTYGTSTVASVTGGVPTFSTEQRISSWYNDAFIVNTSLGSISGTITGASSASLTTGVFSLNFAANGNGSGQTPSTTFHLTGVGNSSGGNAVYTGTFGSCPANGSYVFTQNFDGTVFGGPNNGVYQVVGCSFSALTVNNPHAVAETNPNAVAITMYPIVCSVSTGSNFIAAAQVGSDGTDGVNPVIVNSGYGFSAAPTGCALSGAGGTPATYVASLGTPIQSLPIAGTTLTPSNTCTTIDYVSAAPGPNWNTNVASTVRCVQQSGTITAGTGMWLTGNEEPEYVQVSTVSGPDSNHVYTLGITSHDPHSAPSLGIQNLAANYPSDLWFDANFNGYNFYPTGYFWFGAVDSSHAFVCLWSKGSCATNQLPLPGAEPEQTFAPNNTFHAYPATKVVYTLANSDGQTPVPNYNNITWAAGNSIFIVPNPSVTIKGFGETYFSPTPSNGGLSQGITFGVSGVHASANFIGMQVVNGNPYDWYQGCGTSGADPVNFCYAASPGGALVAPNLIFPQGPWQNYIHGRPPINSLIDMDDSSAGIKDYFLYTHNSGSGVGNVLIQNSTGQMVFTGQVQIDTLATLVNTDFPITLGSGISVFANAVNLTGNSNGTVLMLESGKFLRDSLPGISAGSYYGPNFYVGALAPPNNANVAIVGTPGTTLWCYVATSVTSVGESLPTSQFCTFTSSPIGNATLNGTNYNTVAFNGNLGTQSINIYRYTGAGGAGPQGLLCNVTVASPTCNDQGTLVNSNAPPTTDTSGKFTLAGAANGCATFTSGILGSTGTACGSGGGTGFPITLGSTSIAGGSTTTAVTGLSVNGVTLNAAGSSTLFLNQAGGYTAPSGGGAVSSVANSDGTLTISPTTGSVVASLALGHANTWTAKQTINGAALAVTGSSGNNFLVSPISGAYTFLSFNGATSNGSNIGLVGGGTGDNTLYVQSLGNIIFMSSGTTVGTLGSGGNFVATSFNGVALTAGGSATTFLNASGTYTTPSGGSGLPCSGTCTAGILPLFGSGGTSITNSLLDYGVTTASTFTFGAPVAIAGSSTHGFTLPVASALPTPIAGAGVFSDTSGDLQAYEAGGSFSRICTVGNTLCGVRGTGTYTTATSDTFTITGVTASSNCTFSPTNATAAAATVVGFISSVTTNSVTITHVATTASGGTVNIHCTVN